MGYPDARRSDFAEELHGVQRPDPYRWMETESDELKKWIGAQNNLSAEFLADVPWKEKAHDTIKNRLDYPKHGIPFKQGDMWYYYYNTGLQNQSVLYQKKDIDDKNEEAKVFLDPNTMSEDGTTAVCFTAWSDCGTYLAYGLQKKGSDWTTAHVKNCYTGEELPDVVPWLRYSGASWTHDGKGFFYSRFPAVAEGTDLGTETDSAKDMKLCYHFLGTDTASDPVIYYDENTPTVIYGGSVTTDGTTAVITASEGCKPENKIMYIDLATADLANLAESAVVKLVDEWKWEYSLIDKYGDKLYFMTTDDSPNKKVVSVNLKTGEWKDVIPERDEVLQWVDIAYEGRVYVSYMKDVKDVVYSGHIDSPEKLEKLDIEIGSVGFSISHKHPKVFYYVTSFTFAKRIYTFDMKEGHSTRKLWYEVKIPDYDSSLFDVEQVFYPSKDGTKIPMFMIYKKTMKRDGQNPTLLYAYGGFHCCMEISFSTSRLTFLNNMNGVYCIANIRGGAEYGENWWKGGSLRNKQNCFDDMVWAAKWLQENKITSPDKLAIQGGSNGGTLVAGCANQHPDLFKSVVAEVGVMDMTRFHKFTIGAAWRSDYGDPDVKEDYEYILTYSPLHNISSKSKYPYILCATGDHDDRVAPLHTFKYLAELQHECKGQDGRFFARVEINAGHGDGKPLEKVIDELTFIWSFVGKTLGTVWTD